ncbi:transposase, partial [Vibrio anguillarum]|nr:transposase [Vibrio anguillarum]
STVEGNSKQKRKFIFRRDPRDISTIWFYDPQLEMYYPIPYRNTSFPAVTIWEFKAALSKLKEEGRRAVDEDIIFDAIEKMRLIESSAVSDTKKARRADQRRRSSSAKSVKTQLKNTALTLPSEPSEELSFDEDDEETVQPFDELLDMNRYE